MHTAPRFAPQFDDQCVSLELKIYVAATLLLNHHFWNFLLQITHTRDQLVRHSIYMRNMNRTYSIIWVLYYSICCTVFFPRWWSDGRLVILIIVNKLVRPQTVSHSLSSNLRLYSTLSLFRCRIYDTIHRGTAAAKRIECLCTWCRHSPYILPNLGMVSLRDRRSMNVSVRESFISFSPRQFKPYTHELVANTD